MTSLTHRTIHILLISLLVLATGACSDELDTDIDDRVTITQGVYGQLISGCDVGDCSDSYIISKTVGAFLSMPEREGATPELAVKSDEKGVFQMPLSSGTYFLALDESSAAEFSIRTAMVEVEVTDARVRHDFLAGPGGGFWTQVP